MNSPLKWMGGKTKLIPFIQQFIPKEYNTYLEPFFGSGALFFHLSPENALCSDIQKQPIAIMNAIKTEPNRFYTLFIYHSENLWSGGSKYYYSLRDKFNKGIIDNIEMAAIFMILLRAGFNGLVRFNPKGEWNVPFGDRGHKDSKKQAVKLHNSFQYSRIDECSKLLNTGNKLFFNQSFEKTIQTAGEGDLVYCDPPYLITTQHYNGWNQDDENRLADELKAAHKRGVKFILSNVYKYKEKENNDLLELYKYFKYELFSHNYVVGPDRHQIVQEIIIYN